MSDEQEPTWSEDDARTHTEVLLRARVAELEAAIRSHRDQRGDDRCWMDDETLYATLPEGYTPPPRDSAVELTLCEQYIACRHNPATQYVSPQRRIDELEAENAALREALKPFAAWWERYGAGEIATEAVAAYRRAWEVSSSSGATHAGDGGTTT